MEFLQSIDINLYLVYAFGATFVASILAAIIPGQTDNKLVAGFSKVVRLIAVNVGNANTVALANKTQELEAYAKRIEEAVDKQIVEKAAEKPAE